MLCGPSEQCSKTSLKRAKFVYYTTASFWGDGSASSVYLSTSLKLPQMFWRVIDMLTWVSGVYVGNTGLSLACEITTFTFFSDSFISHIIFFLACCWFRKETKWIGEQKAFRNSHSVWQCHPGKSFTNTWAQVLL